MFRPPKCCARVVEYSNSPQTHLDRLLHRCVVLILDGDSYRLRDHHHELESGGLAYAAHGVAASPTPMPRATANAPMRLMHFAYPFPLAGPAGARLGAVSLITRAASKRKPRQSTSDRLPVWQPMLPGERNTGSPRCPTRDLVLLYSSSRCPVPIEGGAQCACGAIITASS